MPGATCTDVPGVTVNFRKVVFTLNTGYLGLPAGMITSDVLSGTALPPRLPLYSPFPIEC